MFRSHAQCFSAVMLSLSALAWHAPATLGGAPERPATVALDDIERAWRERASRFHSGRISWTETRLLTKGALRKEAERTPFSPDSKGSVPAQDVRQAYSREITFEKTKLRYVHDEPVWNEAIADFWQVKRLSTFDGHVGAYFVEDPPSVPFRLRGNIRPDAGLIVSMLSIKPVLYHFCPETRAIGHLARYSVEGYRDLPDGSKCVVLVEKSGVAGPSIRRTMWLDPARGFLVRRWMDVAGPLTLSETNVSYKEDAEHRQVPTGWKRLEHDGKGALTRSVEAKITALQLNQAIDPSEFKIDFPANTLVVERNPRFGREEERTYLILPGGGRLDVTDAEMFRGAPP